MRICQEEKEEVPIDLGCHCKGGLAKAHKSCIDAWFLSRGSNKCEICQEAATNILPPDSIHIANFWVWSIDPNIRGPNDTEQRRRACFTPLWVAFSILVGGFLLDVLISLTLGIPAQPVNIIIVSAKGLSSCSDSVQHFDSPSNSVKGGARGG